jgi:hypothetical protein
LCEIKYFQWTSIIFYIINFKISQGSKFSFYEFFVSSYSEKLLHLGNETPELSCGSVSAERSHLPSRPSFIIRFVASKRRLCLCELSLFVRAVSVCASCLCLCELSLFVRAVSVCASCLCLCELFLFVRAVSVCASCLCLCELSLFVRALSVHSWPVFKASNHNWMVSACLFLQ